MAEKKKVKPPVEQLVDADARKKALKMALDQISKQFGKDAILSMGSQPAPKSGCCFYRFLYFGLSTRRRRPSRGRIVEIYRSGTSGKTTLTLHILAECRSSVEPAPLSTRNTH